MEKEFKTIRERVQKYFKTNGATIHIDPIPDQEGYWEYLDTLIQENFLDLPGFNFKGYSGSQFDSDHWIHNFYFELKDNLTHEQTIQAIKAIPDHELLDQDDSQPRPFYTCYAGSLYITIIGEA